MTDSPDPEFPTENTPPPHSILDRYCSQLSPAEVKKYIHPVPPPTPEEAAGRVYEIKDGELPPNFPRGFKKNFFADTTYLSFGDEGTTATITENGQHMQISQYLANGQLSMYTIDLDGTCEPALGMQRRSDLLEMSEYQYGFGADINIDFDSIYIEMTTGWLRNRWPRVLFEEKEKWKLVQQWVVWRGVVIQQLVLHNLQDRDLEVECVVKTNILIRDADFVNITREFNKEETDNYEEGNAGGYGFVKVHALQKENTREKGNAVAAVMGLFINGEVIPNVGFENGITRLVPKNSRFQLVCGYKLVFLPHDDSDWKRLVITAQDVDIDKFLSETQIKNDIPKDEFLFDREFYIGRNVEHILSVCMIPLAQREVSKGEEVIALTCGDMSGHRVCVSASFFAFKFLLGIARDLREDHPLRTRIQGKCLAHLRWVFQMAKRATKGKFARNYWINGDMMSESPQLLPDGPTDTPFQLLKVYEYWNFLPEGEARQNILQHILGQGEDNIAFQWMQALDKENKRGFFAWPHGHRDGIVYFRLDDHVWIWNAISAIAMIFEWTQASFLAKGSKINKKADIPKWETEWKNLARTYDPDRVKREITQRFTTINDPAKQRMLAVTRSSRETRFAFHSRDTALFYEVNGKRMLDETDPRWYSAMEIQRYFFSNLEWGETDNPLYHGLNILLALQRGQSGADKIFQRSKDIIEKSILINGLIPDQLDSAGGEEDASYTRDLLLNIPFETLYLLSGPGKGEFPSPTLEQKSHTAADGFPDSATQRLERTVPFNEKIDENNIVNVKEEWLYNSPPFFEFDPSEFIQEQFNPELGETSLMTLIPEQERLHQVSPFQLYQDTIFRASLDWFDAHESKISREAPSQSYEPKNPQPTECQHMMIDVQKKKSRSKKARQLDERMSRYDTIGDSWKRLEQLRDMDTAKKRLLWFQNAPRDYALMCFLVSPPSERQPIRTFFNRHASSAVIVEDKTSRVRNMWETEFHCGFLQLVETDKDAAPVLTCEMLRLAMDELPKFENHRLVRAAASFRFSGDFFDRFWTCHVIESYPGEPLEGNIKDFFGQDNKRLEGLFSGGRQHVWQQRKILELLLFYRILTHVNKSTRSITDIIREKLAVKTAAENRADRKKGSLGPYDTAVYFESLKKWASLHEVIEILDEELDRVWENANAWETREQDRRTEQPRWTSKDERKYRDALNHVLLLSQNAKRELHSERAKVASLIKSLQYQSDEAKNNYDRHMTERSFQQNDNVKYFTYATVIFQPLAFAASIYSMQSSPPTDVLQHMVICSVVAFFVLLIIVVSLPFLLRPIQSGLWRPTQLWRLFDRNSKIFIWWLKVVIVLTTQGLLFSRDFFAVLSSLRSMRQSSKPEAEKSDVESGLKDGEQSKAIPMSYHEAVAIIREQRGQNGQNGILVG